MTDKLTYPLTNHV